MKTGFIGAGNMASAIIKGLLTSACLTSGQLAVYDIDFKKTEGLASRFGIGVLPSSKAAAEQCDCVVLAVKPQVLAAVLSEIRDVLEEKKPLILTIAAGKSLTFYRDCLGYDARVVRIMPNINAEVLSAVSAYCGNGFATQDDLQFADRFCRAFGSAMELQEALFPIFGVIGGCAPAYAYLFIDALARAAVRHGMPKDKALAVSAQTVLGSAKMILDSDVHPQVLIDRVCSPGGTTIEGLLALQKDGFEAAVADAVRAAVEKDNRLSSKQGG